MQNNQRVQWWWLLILVLFLDASVQGQPLSFKFLPITSEEDVSIRYSMMEGENGFVYMASDNGLCRFDGQRFKFYQHDTLDPHSILSNNVMAVLPMADEIWTGTFKGVSVLDLASNQFRHYQLNEQGNIGRSTQDGKDIDIVTLFKDRQGEIWAGSREHGLWRYNAASDRFLHLEPTYHPPLVPQVYFAQRVNSIEQHRTNDSIIWAGTTAGIMEVNKYTNRVEMYNFPFDDKTYQAEVNIFRRIYHHDDGLVYVGSWVTGIHVFDPASKSLKPLEIVDNADQSLKSGGGFSFIRKSEDQIWISTGGGLYLYSTSEKRILFKKENDLKNEIYYGINMIDSGGRAWYSNFQGLFLSDPHLQQFETFSLVPYLRDDRVNLVFLQDYDSKEDLLTFCPRITDGLYEFDRKNKTWKVFDFPSLEPFNGKGTILPVFGFQQLSGNVFLLSGDQGIFFYDKNTKQLRLVSPDLHLKNIRWTQLLIDKSGALWVGSRASGLFRIELNTGKYDVFKEELLLSDTTASITENMFEDSHGNIWLKRPKGISVYARKEARFYNFIYSEQPDRSFPVVDDFAEDRNGKVWVCSQDWVGYMKSDHPEEGIVGKINIQQNGAEGNCLNIHSDSQGRIWGYTNKEIFRLDEEGRPEFIFNLKFSGRMTDFFGMDILPDDMIVMGGRKAITLVNPNQLTKNKELPTPYITEISVRQSPLNDQIPLFGGRPLYLKSNENFFSIAYAAQAYTLGNEVQFRYRLKGLEEWVKAGAGLSAKYTNVPAGNYTFQLMAANNEGIWNEEMLELPVIIEQAWYKSWEFLSICGFFLILLVYLFVKYRIRLVRKEEKLKADYEKKLAGVEMSALVAQMNPHFLFNSLNSIDSFIIKNESVKASEYLNNFARLMRLVLHKSRASYTSLKDEIETLELYLQMESMRFNDLFSYQITIAPDLNINQIEIPPMLIQPFLENAIWHGLMHMEAEDDGRVWLIFERIDQKLQVTIQDNGIGRTASDELKKNKITNHKESMGMKITKTRIEMINKLYNADASVRIIDLYEDDGTASGTKVILTLAI